jgi:NAD(P)-dependent dehydrogenase (short-subunit alcohol dehydrogenase family)
MNSVKKSVVITGASSGIGRASALRMFKAGWRVFAAVRKMDDGKKLQSEISQEITPLVMDVQDRVSITAAAEQLSSELEGQGLDGLVNVAGIGMVRPIEYATAQDLQTIFEVNVFGQIAVTQAFLPSIRKARGRIVNISSVGAHIAIPFGGLLNASKSAFWLLSDTLRLELRPFGIHVCTIEPGAINTPAVDKTLGNVEAVIANLPAQGVAQYGEMLKNFAARAFAREAHGSTPDVVARVVKRALTSRRPRTRYQAGKDAKFLVTLPRFVPDSLLDVLQLRALHLPSKFGEAAR